MEKDFLAKLTGQLGLAKNITMETKILDIEEWDSLSVVSFGAMMLTEYDVLLNAEEIGKVKTIADLYAYAKQ